MTTSVPTRARRHFDRLQVRAPGIRFATAAERAYVVPALPEGWFGEAVGRIGMAARAQRPTRLS